MWDWLFKPSCPCDGKAKRWVEERLEWLEGEFDDHAFNGRPIVLPTPKFFPAPYNESAKSVRALLDQVCEYMDVDPDRVDLEIVDDVKPLWLVNESGQALPQAAGTYQEGDHGFLIRIDKSGLHEPMDLVGTIAHELAHVRLLGEDRISHRAFDNELLTDLTVCFFGLGIFLANTPRTWDSQYTRWPDSQLLKPEYMTPPMFGYALAHLAWFRGELKSPWARWLHPDARANLNQGLRYLIATADSNFKPPKFRGRD